MVDNLAKPPRKPKEWIDYAFCLVIGTVFINSLTRTIFSATIIRVEQGTLVTMGLFSIILFLVAFHNRITRIISLILGAALGLYVLHIFRVSTYYSMHPRLEHFYNLFDMIGGMAGFDPALGRTAAWVVSMLFAMLVVIFMFHKFIFSVLAGTGVLVFLLTWGPGFSRDETGFLLFLFVFCVILIRRMNSSVSSAFLIAPLCAMVVWFANGNVPTDSEMFMRRSINQLSGTMEAIGDRMFEIFNPTYFSFQSTGFSGAGGRLGGPVTLNTRTVMDVTAPGGIYLAGAVSNTYTGGAWIPTLEDGDINTHGLPPGQLEMLETVAALIRSATIAHESEDITQLAFVDVVPGGERSRFQMHHFPTIGILAGGGYYLHSYLPIDTVSISMGRQRTGTVFRPNRAWSLAFTGTNYSPVIATLPTGDMQAPRIMSRGTGYNMRFLNVNPQLSFVEYLLRQTNPGVYAQRADNDVWWQQATFGGEIIGLTPLPYYLNMAWGDQRNINFRYEAAPRMKREDIPDDYFIGWLPYPPSGYYYVHSVFQNYWPVFTPFPVDEALLDKVNELMIAINLRGQVMYIAAFEAAIAELLASVPPEYVTTDLTITHMGGRIAVGHISQDEFEITNHSYLTPLTNYWNNYSLSQEIANFENISYFGVTEMQSLFNLFADPNQAQYLPTESYLLHWIDMFAISVLAEYAQQVRQHFMEVPEIVPQRVHDLTMQIVDGKTNDFDRVMAIRDYLLQFPYTLNPVHVPRGVCFVDHFLFVGREGYCTYFASAMAIMARIAGVPSRYVEGFVLPPSGNDAEWTTVTNRMAHAWAEVYLEGFGWLIVEATPTYAFLADQRLPAPRGDGAGHMFDDYWLYIREHYMDNFEWYMEDMFNHTPGQGIGTTQAAQEGYNDRNNVISLTLVLSILAAVGVVLFLIMQFWQVCYAIRKMKRLPYDQQVIAYFDGILNIVTYYTIPMAPGETPKIYGGHKGKRFAFKSDSIFFTDLITLYYKAKYSPHEISEAECELMEEAYFDMVNLLRMKRLPIIFMYLRYIRRIGAVNLAQG